MTSNSNQNQVDHKSISLGNVILQEEPPELSTNEELKVKFQRGYQTFLLQAEIPGNYPELWVFARKPLIAFPSSYLVEKSFGLITNFLTEKRSRLNITARGDLRLLLTKLNPNIDNLLSILQLHPSH